MRESDEADPSASTAEFRAFMDRSGGTETTQSWAAPAPRRRTATVAVIVVGVVVVLAIVAFLLAG